ncbi:MAG: CDP-diacylglycerol--glycerol-3-phosphate 3-phosphatidyltransferase [Pseudomonadota bacterium]
MIKQIPNLLTLTRFVLAPIVAYALWRGYWTPLIPPTGPEMAEMSAQAFRAAEEAGRNWTKLAAGLFVFAALTDLFDGWAARALDADSKFGRVLDPIADKALVGLPLIALTVISGYNLWILIPTLVIVGRDLLITILRLAATDGEGAPVSALAKWKTALELIAVATPIFFALLPAVDGGLMAAWLFVLWIAAALSLYTGARYLIQS